jgi:hypothetical protein
MYEITENKASTGKIRFLWCEPFAEKTPVIAMGNFIVMGPCITNRRIFFEGEDGAERSKGIL